MYVKFPDLTKELKMLNGIPLWKWLKLRSCVDTHFERMQKDNILTLNEDIINSGLISFNTDELDT